MTSAEYKAAEPMKRKPKRGGARPGAGRKKGGRNANAKGRTVKTASVSMPPEDWEKLDIIRQPLSRGKWIAGKVSESVSGFTLTVPAR